MSYIQTSVNWLERDLEDYTSKRNSIFKDAKENFSFAIVYCSHAPERAFILRQFEKEEDLEEVKSMIHDLYILKNVSDIHVFRGGKEIDYEVKVVLENEEKEKRQKKIKLLEDEVEDIACDLQFLSPIDGKPIPEEPCVSQICPYCKVETNLTYRLSKLPKNATLTDTLRMINDWEKDIVETHGMCAERHAISGRLTV
jgi:hypothetical protein